MLGVGPEARRCRAVDKCSGAGRSEKSGLHVGPQAATEACDVILFLCDRRASLIHDGEH